MPNPKPSRQELLVELAALRKRVAELEAAEVVWKQAEEALRHSEERYRMINESISDYAFSFHVEADGTLRLDWLTDSFTRITGYAVPTLVGRPNTLQTYIHPDDLDTVVQTVRSIAPGQLTEYEFRIMTRGEDVRWLRSRAQAVVDEQGRKTRIYGATQDITERKHAEEALLESEKRFVLFLHHLPGVAFIKDLAGRYLYVNETATKLYERESVEWIGKTDDEVLPPEVARQLQANDRRVLAEKAVLQTVETLPQKDGTHDWLVSKFPITDKEGNPVMLGGVGIDITGRSALKTVHSASNRRRRRTV